MDAKVIGLVGSWMIAVLSIGSFAASSDLRLAEAVEKRDQKAVRSLLGQHVDVNTPQADGATALMWASHWDDLGTVDLLIGAGANVNASNDYGVTALSLACTNGNVAMVEKLLQAGADPNAALQSGETPLMTAARTGNADVVKLLRAHGADVDAKEARRGQTALMWAVAQKHAEVVRALIEYGADVHARSHRLDGFTPLLVATYGPDVPTSSQGGFTALLFAAQQGDLDLARILLTAGANVNEATPGYGNTLVVAAAGGHEALAAFLLSKGADPNVADGNGITALHYALLKGIAILSGIERGETYYCCESYWLRPNMPGLVKMLLAHGANPNTRLQTAPLRLPVRWRPRIISLSGVTPFLLAAATADVDVMRVLVANGADPLLGTKDNTTPLMVAAGLGRNEDRMEEEARSALEAVKMAVELGADVNAADETGKTALHGAAFTGADSVIQFLVDKGAKVGLRDKCGQTPLSIAEGDPTGLVDNVDRARAHKSTVGLLRRFGGDSTPPIGPAVRCAEVGGINYRYRRTDIFFPWEMMPETMGRQ